MRRCVVNPLGRPATLSKEPAAGNIPAIDSLSI